MGGILNGILDDLPKSGPNYHLEPINIYEYCKPKGFTFYSRGGKNCRLNLLPPGYFYVGLSVEELLELC